jgi:L-lactate dehydrogenase complex protein LldF
MDATSRDFPANAVRALGDATLGRALEKLQREFRRDRAAMLARMPEFEALRDAARDIRAAALDDLPALLERFEDNVTARGGQVHWCADAAEARAAILALCRAAGAQSVVKGKSMISEEIGLNDHLEANGVVPVETDLGEYILQLRRETPSHVVMPAIHLNVTQIGDGFRDAHTDRDPHRALDADAILAEARDHLRDRFVTAQVGITGANMLIAETGSIVLVTNEGNGDLVHTLAPVHIVVASIEKVVPTVADALTLVRVLARSATTQEITSYTSIVTGPKRPGDADGPGAFHVVLLDNGRSRLLGGPFRDILRCIRCGACQSLCPVYGAVGGHAYGWVYAGPVGAVLTPALTGIEEARHLPAASTLCGQCEAVCPVRIPLPALLRRWREEAFARALSTATERRLIRLWAQVAARPLVYRPLLRLAVAALTLAARLAGGGGRFRTLPFAGGWTGARDFPAPQGGTFVERWHAARGRGP